MPAVDASKAQPAAASGRTAATRARTVRNPLAGERRRVLAAQALLLGGLLVVWEIAGRAGIVNPRLFSYPSGIIGRIVSMLAGEDLHGHTIFEHLLATGQALAVGFAIGATVGVVLGFVLHVVADAIDPAWVDGRAPGGASWLADAMRHWTIVPTDLAEWVKPVAYVGLVAAVLVLSLVRGWARIVLLAPVLVLASFVWENVMLTDPASTRYVLLGAMLVGVMVFRPAGLLGERRVEIV